MGIGAGGAYAVPGRPRPGEGQGSGEDPGLEWVVEAIALVSWCSQVCEHFIPPCSVITWVHFPTSV